MNDNKDERIKILVKEEGIEKLKNSSVLVFGLGGVGSFVVEALARSFVGNLTIVDFDKIDLSNINRQIHANIKTIGLNKTDEIEKRIKSINPSCNILKFTKKVSKDNLESFFENHYDYVVDAIDDYEAKLELIKYCKRNKIKIISSMGLGNRLNPTKVKITKLKDTFGCGLARKLRRDLKNVNLTVVSSSEHAIKHDSIYKGSVSFVPSVGGLLVAGYVVNSILDKKL